MPRPIGSGSRYVPGLDGMRAIAVLAVIAYHLNFSWAQGGLLGVGVFFVLSGYLITDLLVSEHRRNEGTARPGIRLPRFWARRARRLLPALFVMLFVVMGWVTLVDHGQLPALRSDLVPGVFYYSNWWFVFEHISYFAKFGPPSPLGHLWSLAIEEQFYILWPFLVLTALKWVHRRRTRVLVTVAMAMASATEMALLFSPGGDPTRVYDGTDTRAFGLLIGAGLAFVLPRDWTFAEVSPGARRLLEVVGSVALAGIFVMFWQTDEYQAFLYRGGLVVLCLLTALVVAVTIHPGARLGSALGWSPLRWLGERSYGIYLWHYPVIVLTSPLNSSPNLLRAAVQTGASIGLAALSWRYVEEPIRHGALSRLWQRLRQHGWSWSRLRPLEWSVAGIVLANATVCSVGLSGAVAVPAGSTPRVASILPPVHGQGGAGTPSREPARTTRPPGTSSSVTTAPPAGHGVTAIGDSVLVDATPYLEQALPGIVIDAEVGQQLVEVTAAKLKADGDVGNRLVLELGTNGPYSVTQLRGLLDDLGPSERVVLVNTRVPKPWQTEVNQTIATVAQTFPHTVVVNWYDQSASTPQYFYPDGVHLDPQGAQYYASLIVQALQTPTPGAHPAQHRTKRPAR